MTNYNIYTIKVFPSVNTEWSYQTCVLYNTCAFCINQLPFPAKVLHNRDPYLTLFNRDFLVCSDKFTIRAPCNSLWIDWHVILYLLICKKNMFNSSVICRYRKAKWINGKHSLHDVDNVLTLTFLAFHKRQDNKIHHNFIHMYRYAIWYCCWSFFFMSSHSHHWKLDIDRNKIQVND